MVALAFGFSMGEVKICYQTFTLLLLVLALAVKFHSWYLGERNIFWSGSPWISSRHPFPGSLGEVPQNRYHPHIPPKLTSRDLTNDYINAIRNSTYLSAPKLGCTVHDISVNKIACSFLLPLVLKHLFDQAVHLIPHLILTRIVLSKPDTNSKNMMQPRPSRITEAVLIKRVEPCWHKNLIPKINSPKPDRLHDNYMCV